MAEREQTPDPAGARMAELELNDADRFEELSSDDGKAPPALVELTPDDEDPRPKVPPLYTSPPPLFDGLATQSSKLQDATVLECLPYMATEGFKSADLNSHGVPKLQRAKHRAFVEASVEVLPEYFVALDASRPWIIYWATASLGMLGVDVAANDDGDDGGYGYGARAADTFRACQSAAGGFGGSDGQMAHLACSYAALLSLVAIGGEDAWGVVDRKAMWRWLGRMKQPDGGFTMCEGGEEDTRGAFCAMVICSLLNLPPELPPEEVDRVGGDGTLLGGLAEWLSRCQTYEGGIGASPGNEAHGAYTFCALGCLCILGPPHETVPKYLNVERLLAWLSHRQDVPAAGFAGRTNKLVDGCYSHWAGGCWSLLEAALLPSSTDSSDSLSSCWDREGLVRYILCCAQNEKGGLRDKPSKHPDGYHTCYNLAGLSWAQDHHIWRAQADGWDMTAPLSAPFGWSVAKRAEVPSDDADRVAPVHPIYVIPYEKAAEARKYFLQKVGF